jgi:hypothetical protein
MPLGEERLSDAAPTVESDVDASPSPGHRRRRRRRPMPRAARSWPRPRPAGLPRHWPCAPQLRVRAGRRAVGLLQRPLGLASLAPQRTPRPQAPPHPLRVGASCSTRLELWWEPRLGAVETMADELGRRSWYSRGRGSRLGAGSSPTASAAPPHARAATGPPACCAAAAPAPCRAPALLRLVRSSLQACTAPSFRACPCTPHHSLAGRAARRTAPRLFLPGPPKCTPAAARIRLGCTPRGGKEGACRGGERP